MKRRRFLRGAGALVLALPALRSLAATARTATAERHVDAMGSIASITAFGRDPGLCDAAIDAAVAELRAVERTMSSHDPSSALNAVNRMAGRGEVSVHPDVVDALASARSFHACTGGAFDPTVGPLLELYGFFHDRERRRAPSDREIADRLGAVGMRNVVLDAGRSTAGLLVPGARIDLGGIGVGMALDRAAAAMRERGVEAALLNHGGDIVAIGAPPGTDGWEVGIQDPFDPRGTLRTFVLRDRCVSTSGNYENYVETSAAAAGAPPRRIGHILDPTTGRNPSRYASVSVFASTSVAADALSTGLFTGGARLVSPPPPGTGRISVFSVAAEEDAEAAGRSRGAQGARRPVTGFIDDLAA